MIQFNLLPDVKLDFIKAQRMQRLVLSIAVLVSIASVVILGLLLGFGSLQKKHLSDLNKNITSESTTLRNEPQINKILTVQSQLESLAQLHNEKPAVAQVFGYLNQLTPANVDINDFNTDFNAHTLSITGTADSLSTINTFVDTLKYATYTATVNGKAGASTEPFSAVVLSSFGINSSATTPDEADNYTITASFDPTIFDNADTITLTVPSEVTTRSDLDEPTDIFTAPTTATTTNGTSQ